MVYYGDGTTSSSKNGPWEKAPAHGVQAVVVYFAETYQCWHGEVLMSHNYKNVLHGALLPIDYYWMLPDGSIGAGNAEQIPAGAIVKEGSWSENFPAIINRAQQEETWV